MKTKSNLNFRLVLTGTILLGSFIAALQVYNHVEAYTGINDKREVVNRAEFTSTDNLTNTISEIHQSNNTLFITDIIAQGSSKRNHVESLYSHILGGGNNNIKSANITILGGKDNTIDGHNTTVLGGNSNTSSENSSNSALIGGTNNKLSGNQTGTIIIGGKNNTIKQNVENSQILGGKSNTIEQNTTNTTVAGNNVTAKVSNSFIFNNNGNFEPESTGSFYLNLADGLGLNGNGNKEGINSNGSISFGEIDIINTYCNLNNIGLQGVAQGSNGCIVGCTTGSSTEGNKRDLLSMGNSCKTRCKENNQCVNPQELEDPEDFSGSCIGNEPEHAHQCAGFNHNNAINVGFKYNLVESCPKKAENQCIYTCDNNYTYVNEGGQGVCKADCKTKRGERVKHNESTTGYDTPTVTCAEPNETPDVENCTNYKHQAILHCDNGTLTDKTYGRNREVYIKGTCNTLDRKKDSSKIRYTHEIDNAICTGFNEYIANGHQCIHVTNASGYRSKIGEKDWTRYECTCESNRGFYMVNTGDNTNVACRKDCTTPWDTGLKHGEGVWAYKPTSIQCTGNCQSLRRTCLTGILLGDTSYNQKCCTTTDKTCEKSSNYTVYRTTLNQTFQNATKTNTCQEYSGSNANCYAGSGTCTPKTTYYTYTCKSGFHRDSAYNMCVEDCDAHTHYTGFVSTNMVALSFNKIIHGNSETKTNSNASITCSAKATCTNKKITYSDKTCSCNKGYAKYSGDGDCHKQCSTTTYTISGVSMNLVAKNHGESQNISNSTASTSCSFTATCKDGKFEYVGGCTCNAGYSVVNGTCKRCEAKSITTGGLTFNLSATSVGYTAEKTITNSDKNCTYTATCNSNAEFSNGKLSCSCKLQDLNGNSIWVDPGKSATGYKESLCPNSDGKRLTCQSNGSFTPSQGSYTLSIAKYGATNCKTINDSTIRTKTTSSIEGAQRTGITNNGVSASYCLPYTVSNNICNAGTKVYYFECKSGYKRNSDYSKCTKCTGSVPTNAHSNNSKTPYDTTSYSYSTNTDTACTYSCDDGFYRNGSSCTVNKKCYLKDKNGNNVEYTAGTTVTAYTEATPKCMTTCKSTSITCNPNGSWYNNRNNIDTIHTYKECQTQNRSSDNTTSCATTSSNPQIKILKNTSVTNVILSNTCTNYTSNGSTSCTTGDKYFTRYCTGTWVGNECKKDCSAGTIDGFTYGALKHGGTANVSKHDTTNGKYCTTTASCNNGTVTISNTNCTTICQNTMSPWCNLGSTSSLGSWLHTYQCTYLSTNYTCTCSDNRYWYDGSCNQFNDAICGSTAYNCTKGISSNNNSYTRGYTWNCKDGHGTILNSCHKCNDGYTWNGSTCISNDACTLKVVDKNGTKITSYDISSDDYFYVISKDSNGNNTQPNLLGYYNGVVAAGECKTPDGGSSTTIGSLQGWKYNLVSCRTSASVGQISTIKIQGGCSDETSILITQSCELEDTGLRVEVGVNMASEYNLTPLIRTIGNCYIGTNGSYYIPEAGAVKQCICSTRAGCSSQTVCSSKGESITMDALSHGGSKTVNGTKVSATTKCSNGRLFTTCSCRDGYKELNGKCVPNNACTLKAVDENGNEISSYNITNADLFYVVSTDINGNNFQPTVEGNGSTSKCQRPSYRAGYGYRFVGCPTNSDGTYSLTSISISGACNKDVLPVERDTITFCSSPCGTIDNGSSRTCFKSNSVACGSSCRSSDNYITYSCNNGSLNTTYNSTYLYSSCSVQSCSSCSSPCGTINHGSSKTCYNSPATCPSSCSSISYSCNNGKLSPSSNSSYSSTSCTRNANSCSSTSYPLSSCNESNGYDTCTSCTLYSANSCSATDTKYCASKCKDGYTKSGCYCNPKSSCSAGTKDGYSYSALSHGGSTSVNKATSTQYCTATASCNDGTVTISNANCTTICQNTMSPWCNLGSTSSLGSWLHTYQCTYLSTNYTCTCSDNRYWYDGSCNQFNDAICGSTAYNCTKGISSNNNSYTRGYTWNCKDGHGTTLNSCHKCNNGYTWNGSTCVSNTPKCGSTVNQCDDGTPSGINTSTCSSQPSTGYYERATWTCTLYGSSTSCSYGCFIAGTQVTMADGSLKAIEEIKVGDKLLGNNGINTVQELYRPLLNQQTLRSINGSKAFVSESHPFMTTEGWKSRNPEASMQYMDEEVTLLEKGDILITENGYEEIKSLVGMCAPVDTQLYNFKVDGNHTYYANEYLVHNKAVCPQTALDPDQRCDYGYHDDGNGNCIKDTSSYSCRTKNDQTGVIGAYQMVQSTSEFCTYNGNNLCNGSYIKTYSSSRSSSCSATRSRCSNGSRSTTPQSYTSCTTTTTPSCFLPGTQVLTKNGSKNIEDIEIGDIVLSYNEKTKEFTYNTVIEHLIHEDNNEDIYNLNVDGNIISATEAHRFYTSKSSESEHCSIFDWIAIKYLQSGDVIMRKDGTFATINEVSHHSHQGTVYNLTVENTNTYFVGEGYLVHNAKRILNPELEIAEK